MSEEWTVVGGKDKKKIVVEKRKERQVKPETKPVKAKPVKTKPVKESRPKSKPVKRELLPSRILPLRKTTTQPLPPPEPPKITFASIAKTVVAKKVEETEKKDTWSKLPPNHPYRWGSVLTCSVVPSYESWKYHHEDRIRCVMDILKEDDFDAVGEYLYDLVSDKRIDQWS
jgi:hypothetical protein